MASNSIFTDQAQGFTTISNGRPLMKADGWGFMDYVYSSIWIHELLIANLPGTSNRHGNRSLCISVRGDLDYIIFITVRRWILNVGGTIPWAGSCTAEKGEREPSIFSTHFLTRDANRSGAPGFHQQKFSTMVDCTLHDEQGSLFPPEVTSVRHHRVAVTGQVTDNKLSSYLIKGRAKTVKLLCLAPLARRNDQRNVC